MNAKTLKNICKEKINLKDTKEKKSMSNFTYAQYQDTIAKAQAGSTANNVKVGFFKLKNDGDEALIRINVSSMEDLQFATVHQLGAAQKWMKVGCSSLDNVVIPKKVKKIGMNAFSGCTSLKNITIPKSVKTIEDGAFKDCTSLECK